MDKLNVLRGMIYSKYRSLSSFGKTMGWARQKVDRIVNGKTQPSLSDLSDICSALGISLDEGILFFKP